MIKKAIFPVAGLGTRFLPATKANPKEMLPIVDKPLIQYAAEEAVKAGVTELIFITNSNKRAIEDHFDSNYELEKTLLERDDQNRLSIVRDILPEGVSCAYIRQPQALGLGHAILCAKPVIGNEPFAVLLADDLIDSAGPSCLEQMVTEFEKTQASTVAVQRIERSEANKYGIIEPINENANAQCQVMQGIVEKPLPEVAPSTLAVVGRYLLTPSIFQHLQALKPGAGGELQLTDAIAALIHDEPVYAYEFDGTRYDCGSKWGYIQATIDYGLKHPEVREPLAAMLKKLESTT